MLSFAGGAYTDMSAAGLMDTYYADALQAYSVISYDTFHNILAKEMKAWYNRFPPEEEEVETDSEGEPREPPVVTGVPAPSVMLSFAVDVTGRRLPVQRHLHCRQHGTGPRRRGGSGRL